MRVWTWFVGLAILMFACSGVMVLGDDTITGTGDQPAPSGTGDQPAPSDQVGNETPPPAAAPEAAAPTTTYGALMQSLEAIGIGKPMEDMGFNIYGHVEGGYLYDLSVPDDRTPARTAPGNFIYFGGPYKNAVLLNQADITVSREMVNLPKGQWDFGFLIEAGYGSDFYYTHSNGILDQHNKNGGTGDEDQLDVLQAYGQLGIPIGTGLTLEAGKFVQLLGYEKIDPTQNIFYTHSYGFSYGKPYTMTGVFGKYDFFGEVGNTDHFAITGGVSDGWNQSTWDANGSVDGILQAKFSTSGFDITGNVLFGPEAGNVGLPRNQSNWWIVPEFIVDWKVADQFTLTLDALYGDAPGAVPNASGAAQAGQWASIAGYAKYQLDPHVALATRAEFYYDGKGFTTGLGGTDVDFGEVTCGTEVTPFPDSPYLDGLVLRPEIRFDWANQRVFDFVNYTQTTASVDIYYKF